jgi:hypothetical protein
VGRWLRRSWSTDLNRIGCLTAPDAPWGVLAYNMKRVMAIIGVAGLLQALAA